MQKISIILCSILILINSKIGTFAEELDFPTNYKNEITDTLVFDAEIIVPNEKLSGTLPKIKATYLNYDYEEIKNTFFSNVEIVSEEDYEIGQKVINRLTYAYGSQGELLLSESGNYRIYMEHPRWNKIKSAVEISPMDTFYNIEKYTTEKDFKFATKEQLIEELNDILSNIGIENNLLYSVYYLDHLTMQQEEIMERNPSSEGWSSTDDGYYFVANQQVENLPVYSWFYYGMGIEGSIEAANIHAFWDCDGIEMIEINSMIDSVIYSDEKWELLPFESIIETIHNRFSLAITDNKTVIQKMKLGYMAEHVNEEYLELYPTWFCDYQVTDSQGNTSYGQILLNAANGKELFYELP